MKHYVRFGLIGLFCIFTSCSRNYNRSYVLYRGVDNYTVHIYVVNESGFDSAPFYSHSSGLVITDFKVFDVKYDLIQNLEQKEIEPNLTIFCEMHNKKGVKRPDSNWFYEQMSDSFYSDLSTLQMLEIPTVDSNNVHALVRYRIPRNESEARKWKLMVKKNSAIISDLEHEKEFSILSEVNGSSIWDVSNNSIFVFNKLYDSSIIGFESEIVVHNYNEGTTKRYILLQPFQRTLGVSP